MKQVIYCRNDAIRFVDRVCNNIGLYFEKPQFIEIRRYKPPRSMPQNAMFHAMIRELSQETGHTEDELKEYFKSSFGPRKILEVCGEEKLIPISTTLYNKMQMSDLIAQVERVGAELGVRFSDE